MTEIENIAYIENIIVELRTLYNINGYDFKITYKVGDYVYSEGIAGGTVKLIGIDGNNFIAIRSNGLKIFSFSPQLGQAFGYNTRLATNKEIVGFRYGNILREMKLKGL